MMKAFLFIFSLLILGCDFYAPKEEALLQITEQDLSHPTFSLVKQKIFEPKCVLCHAPGKAGQRILMDTRDDLINSPLDLVIPGNVDDSVLLLAVTRTDSRRMPPVKSNVPPLMAQEIKLLEIWILNGAIE